MNAKLHTLFPVTDLPENSSKAVTVDGKNILVCKASGHFYAVDNMCTHQRSELEGGRIRNCFLSCPLHGVRFDLRTGVPKGELTKVPLKTYEITVGDDGNLQIKLD